MGLCSLPPLLPCLSAWLIPCLPCCLVLEWVLPQFGSLAGPLAALVASSCLLLAIDVARFVPSGEGGDAAEGGQEEEKKQA